MQKQRLQIILNFSQDSVQTLTWLFKEAGFPSGSLVSAFDLWNVRNQSNGCLSN